MAYISQAYCYPFFHQSWNLFAPPPDANYKLFVDYEGCSAGCDIFSEVLHEHRKNSLKGLGPVLIALTNSIHYFEKNAVGTNKLTGPIKNDVYFDVMAHTVRNYINSSRHLQLSAIKIILVVEEVKNHSRRAYYN